METLHKVTIMVYQLHTKSTIRKIYQDLPIKTHMYELISTFNGNLHVPNKNTYLTYPPIRKQTIQDFQLIS